MLTGTAGLEELAADAPVMPSFDAGPVRFERAEVLQAAFEMTYASRERALPPGLHPTTPPLMIVLGWSVEGGDWGPFSMAQIRVSCRSGVRPRGFVRSCVVSNEEAAAPLRSGWGLPATVGPVRLERFYDMVRLSTPGLEVAGLDPDPLGPGDVQYSVTTTLARTPRGLRLVQVEPEYELERVERVRPRLESFAGDGTLEPRHPVTASVAVGSITLPKLRFVSRPDVLAFDGTETI